MLTPLLLAAAGCGTDFDYLLHVSSGYIGGLARTRPIAQVLSEGSVTADQAAKLQLVLRLREFARDRIGLNVGDAYSLYENNSGAIAYVVSAAHKDRLEPYHWEFPVIGAYDVKGFFDRSLAQAEADRLTDAGYDVYLGEADGFSTLGLLAEPIRASQLTLSNAGLAELILHELTHRTIYKPSDGDFNESMATFIGRTAAQTYFDETFGHDSPEAMAARERFDDLRVVDDYVIDLYMRIAAFYDQPISSDEKIAGRTAVFDSQRQRWFSDFVPRLRHPDRFAYISDIGLNNAAVLAGVRYQAGLDVYQRVFDKLGHDFAALLEALRQAAQQSDSRAFLDGL